MPADAEPSAAIDDTETPADEIESVDQSRTARSRPVASEPVIQRVMVGPNGNGIESAEAPEADNAQATPKPQRRGWWQRQFGG
jgi:hypothetical protein